MDLKQLYREIINEHNLHPGHKKDLSSPTCVHDGVNPSCGDEINLQLSVDKDGVITDGSFNGSGCAISQASVDIMLDLIIGKKKDEALKLADIFMGMIKNGTSEENLDMLEEAAAFSDISHMPARVKCAVLGWHTLQEMLSDNKDH